MHRRGRRRGLASKPEKDTTFKEAIRRSLSKTALEEAFRQDLHDKTRRGFSLIAFAR